MKFVSSRLLSAIVVCSLSGGVASAQSPVAVPAGELTARTINAIGYQVGGGDTKVDLKGTGMLPGVSGEAKVAAKAAVTTVEVSVQGLRSATTNLGTEFLAYVVWAVSTEGRAVNLGELRPDDNGKSVLKATTQLQTFSLFVTAEPYAAVRMPSELVVLENERRKDTKGKLFVVSDYKLLKRSQYQKMGNPLALSLDLKNVPLEMYQARNAVEIAKSRGADRYAPEVFSRAQGALDLAENAFASKKDKKEIVSLALRTTQFSEDARALAAERQEQERVANERAAAAASAKASAEATAAVEAAAAKRRADEDAARQAELAAAREGQLKAEAAVKQAEAARQAEQLRADAATKQAEAARQEAELKAAAAVKEVELSAAAAREADARAEAERARKAAGELRAQLLDQFNRVLETRDSSRGLVITMADVLFESGKYELRPNTREALARLSGIVLAHQGLKLEVEGHTDSTGGDALNQTLSEQRAGAVRGYLVQQGLAADAVSALGLGKSTPVADNGTAAGRQKNRRVELIVSGEVIGVRIGN